MKYIIALSFIALPALAQQVPPPDAQMQALSQTVLELTGQTVQLRTQIVADQQEIKRLNDENAKLKAASPAAPK